MKSKADTFFKNLKDWAAELQALRSIILECDLVEDFKWKHPCYTHAGNNIVLLHGFKEYCALLFPKGALLKDPKNLLIQQTKNTQYGRQLRFTNTGQITELKNIIRTYILEAIENEKSGLKITPKKTSAFEVPKELTVKFKENPKFKKAFQQLTEGRKRGYLLHFAQPKQAKTRTARINRNLHRILDGYGFYDCTCGLSKKMPNCDGSHKQLELN